MAGFQFDTITAASPLDLTAPPARPEPRGEDSFDYHLRQNSPASPPAKTEDSRTTPTSKPDDPPSSSYSPAAPKAADKPAARESSHESTASDRTEASKNQKGDQEATDDSKQSENSSALVADVRQATALAKDGPAGEGEAASGRHASGVSQTAKSGQLAAQVTTAESSVSNAPTNVPDAVNGALNASADAATSQEAVSQSTLQRAASEETARVAAALAKEKGAKTARSPDSHAEPPKSSGNTPGQPLSTEIEKASSVASDKADGHREHDAENHGRSAEEQLVAVDSAADSAAAATIAATQQATEAAAVEDSAQAKGNSKTSAEASAVRPDATDGVSVPAGRLPQHLLARATADHAAAARPLTEADQARFVQRVARAFQTAASQDGELRLRLSPPELGSLRLEVKVQGGVMSARIETENSSTRALLLENLPALRERLAEQNIQVEHFDVDLMNHQGGGSSSGPAQDQGRQAAPPDAAARVRVADAPTEEPTTPRSARRGADEGQLNVLV